MTMPPASLAKEARIGLALGGGGARGLCHIPVFEAFDELGIKPCAISGTSIGAIMGAAYAAGLSGAEIRDISLETFGDRNKVMATLWKLRPKKISDMFTGRITQFNPEKVLRVFTGDYLPEHFEDLNIPLSVVTADFYASEEITFTTGKLVPAVAASMAIPAIFRPMDIDGKVLIDGGVVNPLPFDILPRDCSLVVAVDVVGNPVYREDRRHPPTLDSLFGAAQNLMQTVTREKLKSRHPDLLLRPADDNVRLLDFFKTKEILEQASALKDLTKRELDHLINATSGT